MKIRTTISYLLFPLTMWYAVGVAVRNFLFEVGILKQEAPRITTIGVGNLNAGGSGKTPMVEYLLRLLADHYRVAVLSRGYKRKSKGFLLDDGSHDAALLGDEPSMIASKYPHVQVAVCEKRLEGVRRLMEGVGMDDEEAAGTDGAVPQLIVLDDVYQHRAIKPSINILLTEYHHPFFRDHILPYGNLREFSKGKNRAAIVIVTKCPARLNPVEKHNIIADLRLRSYQKVFFSYLEYGDLRTLDGESRPVDLERMDGVLAVTGIAHPKPMIGELRRQCKVQHLAFGDHHDYTQGDIDRIAKAYKAMPGDNKIIITTEKDAARLRGKEEGLPVYVLPVRMAFHKENDKDFDQIIESSVRENISFLSKLSIWS